MYKYHSEAWHWEVLCLTHENSTPEENLPYLSYLSRPVPILNIFGRSARERPKVSNPDAVWYCWKDRVAQHGDGLCVVCTSANQLMLEAHTLCTQMLLSLHVLRRALWMGSALCIAHYSNPKKNLVLLGERHVSCCSAPSNTRSLHNISSQ